MDEACLGPGLWPQFFSGWLPIARMGLLRPPGESIRSATCPGRQLLILPGYLFWIGEQRDNDTRAKIFKSNKTRSENQFFLLGISSKIFKKSFCRCATFNPPVSRQSPVAFLLPRTSG
jgi:hypothetical protein